MLEQVTVPVVQVQSAPVCSYPEVAGLIFSNGKNSGIADAAWIIGLRFINGKGITIIFVQAILSTYPDQAPGILKDAIG